MDQDPVTLCSQWTNYDLPVGGCKNSNSSDNGINHDHNALIDSGRASKTSSSLSRATSFEGEPPEFSLECQDDFYADEVTSIINNIISDVLEDDDQLGLAHLRTSCKNEQESALKSQLDSVANDIATAAHHLLGLEPASNNREIPTACSLPLFPLKNSLEGSVLPSTFNDEDKCLTELVKGIRPRDSSQSSRDSGYYSLSNYNGENSPLEDFPRNHNGFLPLLDHSRPVGLTNSFSGQNPMNGDLAVSSGLAANSNFINNLCRLNQLNTNLNYLSQNFNSGTRQDRDINGLSLRLIDKDFPSRNIYDHCFGLQNSSSNSFNKDFLVTDKLDSPSYSDIQNLALYSHQQDLNYEACSYPLFDQSGSLSSIHSPCYPSNSISSQMSLANSFPPLSSPISNLVVSNARTGIQAAHKSIHKDCKLQQDPLNCIGRQLSQSLLHQTSQNSSYAENNLSSQGSLVTSFINELLTSSTAVNKVLASTPTEGIPNWNPCPSTAEGILFHSSPLREFPQPVRRNGGSGFFHLELDYCYDQFRLMEKERLKTEKTLYQRYPGRDFTPNNCDSFPKSSHSRTRVDRLVVDHFGEHAKVVSLVSKLEELRERELHCGIHATFSEWQGAIEAVQEVRSLEIQFESNCRQLKGRHNNSISSPIKDFQNLPRCIEQLSMAARKARTAFFCAFILTTLFDFDPILASCSELPPLESSENSDDKEEEGDDTLEAIPMPPEVAISTPNFSENEVPTTIVSELPTASVSVLELPETLELFTLSQE